jgi:hypothetical protein
LKKTDDDTPALDDGPTKFTNLVASMAPQEGDAADFDFQINLTDPTDIGAQSDKL